MKEDISRFCETLPSQQVLVVGDVMVDAYLWGDVTRISPEAPVPIVSVKRREKRLGGAANVASNIHSLGATPIICSVLGNDDAARDFMQIMYAHNMDRRGIILSDQRKSTVKSRVIGNNMHIVRVDEEETHSLSADEEEQLLDRIRRILKQLPISAIVFQDYDKGNITQRVIDEVVDMARRKRIITTVDPKHRNFASFHDVNLFKPNLKELREGLNLDFETDPANADQLMEELNQASTMLHERQKIETVMITLSSMGVYVRNFATPEVPPMIIPAQRRSVSDVSGAGDTVISVATLALSAGLAMPDVVAVANLAGGIVCEQVGVVPIDKERLFAELNKIY